MANIPEGKRSASFVLTDEVTQMIRAAQMRHVRIDGTRPVRVSEYVEDLLRRDLIAKGMLVLPGDLVMPKKRGAGVKKKPTKKT